jgi:hypothetical protein
MNRTLVADHEDYEDGPPASTADRDRAGVGSGFSARAQIPFQKRRDNGRNSRTPMAVAEPFACPCSSLEMRLLMVLCGIPARSQPRRTARSICSLVAQCLIGRQARAYCLQP